MIQPHLKRILKSGFILVLLPFFLAGCSPADLPWVGGFLSGTGGGDNASLIYWGLFEGPDSFNPLIADYKEKHPKITIDYQQKSYAGLAQYKESLINRLREGKGPDIFRIHASWLKDFQPYLAPLPSKVMGKDEYAQTFFPILKEAASVGETLYGFPLMYDGLVLVANKALLDEAAVSLPQTWDEFRQAAVRLTKVDDKSKKLVQAGVAFGAYGNIPHAVDVLSLMLLQSNLQIPNDLNTQAAADALTFYTNFLTIDRVWDETFPNAVVSFARRQTALIFVPIWRLLDIKNLNADIEMVVGPVPQIPSLEGMASSEIHLASVWIEVVAKDSKAKEVAFDFLKFLTSSDQMRKFYNLTGQNRAFGEPYSRQDLAKDLNSDPYLAALMGSAPKAKLASFNDAVGDDAYVEAFGGAINAVLRGGDPLQSLSNAKRAIEQLQSSRGAPPTSGK